jgi:hypothetical protein
LQAVDEFPGSNLPKQRAINNPEAIVTLGAVNRARMAQSAWESVDLEVSQSSEPTWSSTPCDTHAMPTPPHAADRSHIDQSVCVVCTILFSFLI